MKVYPAMPLIFEMQGGTFYHCADCGKIDRMPRYARPDDVILCDVCAGRDGDLVAQMGDKLKHDVEAMAT